MKKILKYFPIWLLASALAACESQAEPVLPGEDEVEVQFSIAGNYGNPFPASASSRAEDGQNEDSEENQNQVPDDGIYKEYLKKDPQKLPQGSILWLFLEELENEKQGETDENLPNCIVRPFEVDNNGMLAPCVVDGEGTTAPLYLKRGKWYRARVIGSPPETKLKRVGTYSLMITNNQYVFAHDFRYSTTQHKIFEVEMNKSVQKIELNAVIHQNAELRFTIEAKKREEDGYSPVHSLEVMPAGVVVSGLQEHYQLNDEGEPYNWTLGKDYLRAYPGHVNQYMTIYEPYVNPNKTQSDKASNNPPSLEFRGAILPTDAVATPIIVGFYLRVNGVPTMFQMMLNRKMFLHGFYYHYKGIIDIQEGIAVLEWQTVARELERDLSVLK